jgi:hypothetical protein
MRRQCLALCLMLALAACKGEEETPPDGGVKPDAGPDTSSPFTKLTLEAAANELQPLALAVGPGDVIGVAYFFRLGDSNDYEIRYIQVSSAGQVSQPEKVATVQRVYGVSVAFDSNGRPAVAYLGGPLDPNATFWFQNDVAVAFRTGANQWTESVAVSMSNQAAAGNPVSDSGTVVGLFPALVFNGTQAIVAYRDVHQGATPQQDWAGSDLEAATGTPGNWTARMVAAGGNNKQAYGGHISMVLANGQPALVHDQIQGSADGTGSNVLFQRRNTDGSWTMPLQVQTVGNTQKGASLAWDPVLGYGIAVVERSDNKLTFVQCRGSTATQCSAAGDWTTPDPVYQSGTGGWYPSLAIDPKTHDPSIAFYVCSKSPGANEGSCNPNDDELRVTTRIEGNWREVVVDAEGGITPKMAYLSTGLRVIAYRAPGNGVVKLAVEQ